MDHPIKEEQKEDPVTGLKINPQPKRKISTEGEIFDEDY